MQLASSARIPDGLLAAMRPGGEKPHQGLPSRNPGLHQGPTVCNSTTALGLQAAAVLNRVGSCSTGKERDSESGNDYFGARYYASSMGRFMSPDWSAKVAPVPYAKLDNPQTLNLYAYVGNNPLRYVDADGHVQRDKDGNVIFTKTGSTYVTFAKVALKDGSTVTVGWKADTGYIKADDGTKIQSSKATGSLEVTQTDKNGKSTQLDPSVLGSNIHAGGNSADCHGTTFASGQVWINNDQVPALLKGDGFVPTSSPHPWDVGVYSGSNGVDHSVRALAPNQTVLSKGGITDMTITTPANGWSDHSDTLTYYTQHPDE